jgi:ElaB/YqjD/DUF883 family membrane-anchored ribosome-binding protein
MSAEQKNPEEIREDIAEAREQLGDTVEALASKADVKGQAKAKVESAKVGAQEKLGSAKESAQQTADRLASKAKEAAPESFGAGAQQVAGSAQENPVPIAIAAAFAAGVMVGWILSR